MLETKWVLKPCDLNIAKELAYELEIPLCISRVLVSRGIDSISKANDFVDLSLKKLHNPMSLPDAQIVIERISKAIDFQESI